MSGISSRSEILFGQAYRFVCGEASKKKNLNGRTHACPTSLIEFMLQEEEGTRWLLPWWVINVSFYCSILAILIILSSIYLHLKNYRKPFQQRLMIRIQLIVPLFALSCYAMLVDQKAPFNRFVLEPVREVYEAFVIYTFFSLLTDMLGGERNIIIMTSGRAPVLHPGILGYILPPLDISDSHTFLGIKRGILQYVWLKPFICMAILLGEVIGWYDVNKMGPTSIYLWLTIIYNFSVSLSLYCLAIFWKILWDDLKPFKPVGKFLCVKLIIFASYWQGMILAILNAFGALPGSSDAEQQKESIGVCIQSALLCVELVGFAIGHWFSFSYIPFTISRIPNGRLEFKYALKDVIGNRDLVHDFRLTFNGDYYKNYKLFDSVEALLAHPQSNGRMSRINQGMRYHTDGRQKHWLPSNNAQGSTNPQIKAPSNDNSPQLKSSFLPSNHNDSLAIKNYEPSVQSNFSSMNGLYSASPVGSPELAASGPPEPILDILRAEDELADILYGNEDLDHDEDLYREACRVVTNYNLDHANIKRILNYPIVDHKIEGHAYGYRVQKLRKDRLRGQSGDQSMLRESSSLAQYGSIA